MNPKDYRIEEVWDVLDDREKKVIQGRYLDDTLKTRAEIGKQLGCTGSRVGALEKRALHKMRHRFSQLDNIEIPEEVIVIQPRKPAPKPKPITLVSVHERHRRWVKSAMSAMKAFLRGEKIQMRGRITTGGRWEDVDLGKLIDAQTCIEWRPKPQNGAN